MLNADQQQAWKGAMKNAEVSGRKTVRESISEQVAQSIIIRFSSMFRKLLDESPRNGLWSVDIACGSTEHPKYEPALCKKIARIQKELGCTEARTIGIDIGPLRDELFEAYGDTDLRQEQTVLDTLPSGAFDLITCFGFLGSSRDDIITAPDLYDMGHLDYQNMYDRIHSHTRRLLREGGLCLWQHNLDTRIMQKREAILTPMPEDKSCAL